MGVNFYLHSLIKFDERNHKVRQCFIWLCQWSIVYKLETTKCNQREREHFLDPLRYTLSVKKKIIVPGFVYLEFLLRRGIWEGERDGHYL